MDFYSPIEDKIEDMIDICERGIEIATKIKNQSLKAYFLAQKGYFISYCYSEIDMLTAAHIRADNLIGIQTISEEKRQNIIAKLRHMEEDYTQSFLQSLELAVENKDSKILADILILIGDAAVQRYIYLKPMGVIDRAESEKKLCKRVLLKAKEIYAKLNDELSVANTLFNLANNIRCFDEVKEALQLIEQIIPIAKKYSDNRLLQRATLLKETLVSGKIPDYVKGEKRELDW